MLNIIISVSNYSCQPQSHTTKYLTSIICNNIGFEIIQCFWNVSKTKKEQIHHIPYGHSGHQIKKEYL